MLHSFHIYVGVRLRDALLSRLSTLDLPGLRNLCISGGCALNIKWNSDLRRTGTFDSVWVPPFPNDAGSAIGAAASALYGQTDYDHIRWDVYAGPSLASSAALPGWRAQPCSLSQLAELLFREDEPVVFLNGRAETGPRALGNRSILASPFTVGMKQRLNDMKGREPFRPVAPICLEDEAMEEARRLFRHGVEFGIPDMVKRSKPSAATYRRQAALHCNDGEEFEDFFFYPNMWRGFAHVGIPPNVAVVGSYQQVIERFVEFSNAGASRFVMTAYPHLEQIYALGENVIGAVREEVRAGCGRQ